MKLKTTVGAFTLLSLCLGFSSCKKETLVQTPSSSIASNSESDTQQIGAKIDGQYIVQLKPDYFKSVAIPEIGYKEKTRAAYEKLKTLLATLPNGNEIEVLNVYTSTINGFAAKLSPDQVTALQKHRLVEEIEQDQIMGVSGVILKTSTAKADQVPYGVARTGYGSGAGKRAYVIDSGIDVDHPDLNVNEDLGRNYVNTGCGLLGIIFGCPDGGQGSPDDDNGHGTHCAGTIAAKNDGSGVIGVAYDAEVVPIKVLNAAGTGSNSGVIQGVDYVGSTAKAGDVANMSLGGGTSSSLDNAVKNAASKGIHFALAAGNDSQHSNNSSPARANGANIYTVSAMDANDRFASFSNFGNPPVDYCAPGVSIRSTYPGGGYRNMSGTSMAAPHVAGLLLITNGNIKVDGFVKNDPDGNADAIAHK